MKSRVSFVLSKKVIEELDSITPDYKNSSVVNEIIKEYLAAGDYTQVKPIERIDPIIVSFTIDLELMEEFRKNYPVCKYHRKFELDRPRLSESLEYLLKKYLERNRIG